MKGHLRRCFAEGLTCAVVRKGAAEAGTVLVVVRINHDQHRLYGPPPGPAYDEEGQRRWLALFDGKSVRQAEIDDYITKQLNFDPDIWVVDIDDPSGTGLLNIEREQ